MSFDVFAQAFRDGEAAPADAGAARKLLSETTHRDDSKFDHFDIAFADGSELELLAGNLEGPEPFTGAMFVLRGLSEAIADFMFRFARESGCVLLPAMEPSCVLMTDEGQAAQLPPDLRDDFQIIVVNDGREVLAALEGGYDTWKAYRDQIVDHSKGGRRPSDS